VAVSRQVRVLETYLSVALFTRSHRRITLTREGLELFDASTDAFEQLREVTGRISRRGRRDILTIGSYTTFSQRWLIPRLSRFQELHPDIELRITASSGPADFRDGVMDAVIRSNRTGRPDLQEDLLAHIELIPVCSPAFLARTPMSAPEDLGNATLLHSLVRERDWTDWFAASGRVQPASSRVLKFENSALCYEAALQGLGVAMGIRALVDQNLRDGLLVAPFGSLSITAAYYLVSPTARRPSPALRKFHQWLQAQLGREAGKSPSVKASQT
jgi:LysR family glycine cleavage system transcriptional activator